MINLAVIPVAGLGTRLLPATKSQPKEMLPVGRKPVVQYVVEELSRVGLQQILFITGPGKTSIENHFDLDSELIQVLRETGKEELLAELEFERAPVQYFFTRQRRLLGLGHAVSCAQPFTGDQPFVVALGDSIIGLNAQSDIVQRMVACYTDNQADAVIALEEVAPAETPNYGIAQVSNIHETVAWSSQTPLASNGGEIFPLSDVIEKPAVGEAPSNLAIAARYVFSPAIYAALQRTQPGKGGEIQLTDAIRLIIRDGGQVFGVRLHSDEKRYDIGNFESYFQAFIEFALADQKHGASLRHFLQGVMYADHS